jgi:RNA polymerase sigma factor (sigma-70 family)
MQRTSREIYDELLVIRCRKGDSAAWNELVERWNDRMFYYLRRLIDNEQDAANALQDVWIHVLHGLRALKDQSRFSAWLYVIARRTALTHYRRDCARREETADDLAVHVVDDEDVQLQLDNAELVHFGISQLDLPEREVLTLFFLEDLTTAEMAELIGIPAGTVKSRLFKARRELKTILEREVSRHDR